jgi:hypothetical protein
LARTVKHWACLAVALLPLMSAVPAIAQTMAPPPPQAEMAPPPPPHGGGYWVWQAGYWRWSANRNTYVWRPGHYVRAPYAQAVWIPGQWVFVNGRYVWHDGHWRR